MPPKWTPLPEPRKLGEDAGIFYRDQNAARYPNHPMEPAAEAIMKTCPNPKQTSVSDLDIELVACSNTLGNLLRFARGDDRSFRMLVEVVGRTVHLIRRENSPKETIPDVRGYGHTFPEAYTSWDPSVRGSSSHQRILRYHLGDLDCLMRFEGDGYLPGKTRSLQDKNSSGPNSKVETPSVEELTSSLGEHGIIPKKFAGASLPLQISTGGTSVPQKAVFDLKTRSMRRKPQQDAILDSELPRLWLAQIPNFILAYHSSGTFTEIEVQDVRSSITKWESDHEADLRRFAMLLRRIVNIARAKDDGKLEIARDSGEDFLQVREQTPDVPPAFSPDTMQRWKRWLCGSAKGSHREAGAEVGAQDSKEGPVKRDPEVGHDAGDWVNDWSDEEQDLTACDTECGYCGRCAH